MKKQNTLKILLIASLLIVAGYLCYDYFSVKPEVVSYSNFLENLNDKKISNVKISDKDIMFELNTVDKKSFSTQNPNNPDLIERILLSGAKIENKSNFSDVLSMIFDIVFYAFFVVIIIFVIKKFISPNTFKIVRKTNTKFDDIVGMDDLKNSMLQIAQMMKNPSYYQKKGIRVPKGILMEGSPGNGKTMFARALANEAKINFIPTKATDFESMFMSIGPLKVKMLFKKARRNAPCIVFIDEFDGIGTKRNYNGSAIETENTRIVTALLNELDGFTVNDGVLVVAATNSRKALDEALIRPGRFDANYIVPYPDYEDRILLVKKYMIGKNVESDLTPETLAKMFDSFSCAQIESVINKASMICSQKNKELISIDDIKESLKVFV